MRIRTIVLALAVLAAPAAAQFQRPSHLPVPGGRPGHPDLPTPHPQPLNAVYYLRCTLGNSPAGGRMWTVSNIGHNTVPAGAQLGLEFGSLADDYVLSSPLVPGEPQVFAVVHLQTWHSAKDVCWAHIFRHDR